MGLFDDSEDFESVKDTSSDAGGDASLAASLWDDLKTTATSTMEKVTGKSTQSESSVLDFGGGDIYGDNKATNAMKADAPADTSAVKGGGGSPTDTGTRGGGGSDTAAAKPQEEKSEYSLLHPIDSAKHLWDKVWGDDKPKEAEKPAVNEKAVDAKSLTVAGGEYKGEGIQKDFEPSSTTFFKDSDHLEDVAKSRLRQDATPEMVQKYVEEIKKVNGIKNEADIKDGQELELPGHTKDGALVRGYSDSSKMTVSQDGSVKYETKEGWGYETKPDGGGYVEKHSGPKPEDNFEVSRKPDGLGGYVEKHTGQRPEDNYEITRTPDGKYLIADKPGDTPQDKTNDHKDPRIESARLQDALDKAVTDPEQRLHMRQDMEEFEHRCRTEKIPPEQQAKFFDQTRQLLEAKDDPSKPDLPKEKDRIKISEQLLEHAVHPKGIDQGGNNTCAAASLESRLFTKSPGDAAALISEVARTGQFTPADGSRPIKPDASILKPDAEAQKDPTPDGKRTYASQLFQGTAISMEPSGLNYKINNNETDPASPRETFTDRSDGSLFGTTKKFDGLLPSELQDMEKKITGDSTPVTILEHGSLNKDDGQVHVGSPKELSDQLKALKAEGKLPAIVFVHTKNEPFWTDSHGGTAGGSGTYHFVTITDFDEKTGRVAMDNQWGKESDHSLAGNLSTEELYHAMREPTKETVAEMEKVASDKRKAGNPDYSMELELISQKRDLGLINDKQFEEALQKKVVEGYQAMKKASDKGADNLEEDTSFSDQYMRALAKLPESRHQAVQDYIDKKRYA